jgi:hypothetical protein
MQAQHDKKYVSTTGWFMVAATGQPACPLKSLNILPARNPRRAILKSQVPVWLALVNGGAAKRTPARSAFVNFGRP